MCCAVLQLWASAGRQTTAAALNPKTPPGRATRPARGPARGFARMAAAGGDSFDTLISPNSGEELADGIYCCDDRTSTAHRLVSRCPSLTSMSEWYRPPWLLSNGHVSTIWTALRRISPKVEYDRRCLVLEDGGTVGLDHVVGIYAGLGGSSEDAYVRSMVAAVVEAGLQCAVINSRGCGDVDVTSPQLFSARRGSTEDLRAVIAEISQTQGAEPLLAVGWSNGGSIILNTMREYSDASERCPLAGAVVMSVPYDMSSPSKALQGSVGKIYDRSFVRGLLPKVEKFLAQWAAELPHIDPQAVRASESLQDMEAHLISPMFGYKSVYEYYRDASTNDAIRHIDVPTLCISAADDPIALGEGIQMEAFRESRSVALACTLHGGHIGWPRSLQDSRPRWTEQAAIQFIRAVLDV